MDSPEDRGATRQLSRFNDLVRERLPVFLRDRVFVQLGIVGEAGGERIGSGGDSEAACNGWRAGCVGEGDSAARGDGWGAQAAIVVFDVRGEVVIVGAGCGLWSLLRELGRERCRARCGSRGGASDSLGPESLLLSAN